MKKIFTHLLICILLIAKNGTAQTNNALRFDGINDQVNLGQWWTYELFTIQFWVKPGSAQPNAGSTIFEYVNPQNSTRLNCQRICGDNCYRFKVVSPFGSFYYNSLDFSLTPDVWQHVTLTKTSLTLYSPINAYVNGILVATDYCNLGGEGGSDCQYYPTPDGLFYIGNSWEGGTYWNGALDEMRFWSYALTETEIQETMHCPLSGNEPGLVCYYKFNQGVAGGNNTAVSSVTDATSYAHHGTLVGFDLTGTNSNFVLNESNEPTGVGCGNTCLMTCSAGFDEHLLYGYVPSQCATKTAVVENGTGPYTHNWSLDRALLPGESISGANTETVTVCLMDTAQLCHTTTDANNCTSNSCATIYAEDVRCFSGNNQKVKVCHNGNTICVEQGAAAAHLAHGDYIGPCSGTVVNQSELTMEEPAKAGFNIYPNPNNGSFTVTMDLQVSNADKTIRVINMSGQIVKEINTKQNQININLNKQGVYLVQIISNKQIFRKRLIVVAD